MNNILATNYLAIAVIGDKYGKAGNSDSYNKSMFLFKPFSTSANEEFTNGG